MSRGKIRRFFGGKRKARTADPRLPLMKAPPTSLDDHPVVQAAAAKSRKPPPRPAQSRVRTMRSMDSAFKGILTRREAYRLRP